MCSTLANGERLETCELFEGFPITGTAHLSRAEPKPQMVGELSYSDSSI